MAVLFLNGFETHPHTTHLVVPAFLTNIPSETLVIFEWPHLMSPLQQAFHWCPLQRAHSTTSLALCGLLTALALFPHKLTKTLLKPETTMCWYEPWTQPCMRVLGNCSIWGSSIAWSKHQGMILQSMAIMAVSKIVIIVRILFYPTK